MKPARNQATSNGKSLWNLSRLATVSLYIFDAGLITAAVFVLGEDLMLHFDSIEEWISNSGPWATVMFVVLYALLASVFVPDTVLGIAAGTMFGFTHGLLAATLGSLLGAVLQYSLARRLLRPIVETFGSSRPSLAAIQRAVLQQEFRLQFLIRLTPLNRTLTNYMLGAAGVGFIRYIAACAGFMPILCLEVYFGFAGKQMAGVTSAPGRTAALHDAVLFVGLVAAIIVMIIISRMARRAVEAAAATMPGAPVAADNSA